MNTYIEELGIDRLSVADRLRLLEELWDSLADALDSMEFPGPLKAELDRRLASLRDNPSAGSTWEEVKARLSRKTEGKP